MSNMKNLLSGITTGDVELMNNMISDDITESEYDNIISLWEKYGETIYDYWMENYGRELSIKWVIDHNKAFTDESMVEYRTYVTNKFIEWIRSNRGE